MPLYGLYGLDSPLMLIKMACHVGTEALRDLYVQIQNNAGNSAEYVQVETTENE